MRIISGEFRGLKLDSPDGIDTRPTLDRVKEAVFSMLMPYLKDASVLDLFAGSGSLGLEALSRGAKKAVFVDSNKKAVNCIDRNITAAKVGDKSIVYTADSLSFLKDCNDKFDLIFLDPPYFEGFYASVIRLIDERNLLSKNGLIVVEWDYENGFTNDLSGFNLLKEKKYGRVGISVLNRG